MTHLVTVGRTATEHINLGPAQAGRVGAFNTTANVTTVWPRKKAAKDERGDARGFLKLVPTVCISLQPPVAYAKEKRDRQCTYKRSIEARSRNHCCRRKTATVILSPCL
jgi:hypothetical protein